MVCIVCVEFVVTFCHGSLIQHVSRHAFDHGLKGGWRRGGRMGGWVGLRVGFININDMYNNDDGQGGVWVCEADKVK